MRQNMYSLVLAAFLAIVCCTTASVMQQPDLQNGPEKASAHYRVIGTEVSSEEEEIDAFTRETSDVCVEKSEKRIFSFGGCPNVCKSLDDTDVRTESIKCAPYLQFGCSLSHCDYGSGVSCQLDKTLVERSNVTLCQGTKIVIDGIDVRRNFEMQFDLDFHAPPVMTDVYLLADTTGSMLDALKTARKKAYAITNLFDGRPNVAIGVGQFRDERELKNGFRHHQSISLKKRLAREAIQKWRTKAGVGLDGYEANLVALYKIATSGEIGWRSGSRKFVVLFGDWPGHEPTCLDRTAITRDTVIKELQKKGITVVAVNLGNMDRASKSWPRSGCGGSTTASSGQTSAITSATGGAIVSSKDKKQLIKAMKEALSKVKRVYDVDTSDCEDKLKSVHSPSLPFELEATEKVTVTNTISLKSSICAAGDAFKCMYKYTESGAYIEGGAEFEIVNINGCSHEDS